MFKDLSVGLTMLITTTLSTAFSAYALEETKPFSKLPSTSFSTEDTQKFNLENILKRSPLNTHSQRSNNQLPKQKEKPEKLLPDPMESKEKVVEDFLRTVMQCKHVPGLSVAVVRGGRSWTRGMGVKDVKSEVPVDSSTLFGLGSVTKAFTSALLAIALKETQLSGNDISWQTRVKEVVGGDLELSHHLENNVTLEDVLSHRTGLQAADLMAVAGFPADMSRQQFLRELRNLPNSLDFRKYWHYNNWVYSLAADVTEYLLGDTWNTLLKQRLLLPLGMRNSLIVWDDVNVTSSKMARPYHRIRGSLHELDESLYDLRQGRPAGSLAVSADDMTKWMKFLLNEGALPSGDALISRRLMKDMMTSHILLVGSYKDVPVGDNFNGYGFGWFTGSYRGLPTVSHTGGWFGYISSLTLFPTQGVGVYVATSGPGTSAADEACRAISYFLSDIAMGYPPWLNQSSACVFGNEEKREHDDGDGQEGVLADEDVETANWNKIKGPQRYIGRYSNALLGDVFIKESALYHGLVLQFQRLEGFLIPRQQESEFHVQYTGKTSFVSYDDFKVKRSWLSFSRINVTPEGKSISLVLRGTDDSEKLVFTREE